MEFPQATEIVPHRRDIGPTQEQQVHVIAQAACQPERELLE